MSERTPGPWRVVDGGRYIQAPRRDTTAQHDFDIARVLNDNLYAGDAEENAKFIVKAVNRHDALVAACRAALNLAWEVGCESEDGVMTLLDDSRGDLYRQLSAALEGL